MRQLHAVLAMNLLGLDRPQAWDVGAAFEHLRQLGVADSRRTTERRLHELGILPRELAAADIRDEMGRAPSTKLLDWELGLARGKRQRVLFASLHTLGTGRDTRTLLAANDARGARYWVPLETTDPAAGDIEGAASFLRAHIGRDLAILPHGPLAGLCRDHEGLAKLGVRMASYRPPIPTAQRPSPTHSYPVTPHLRRLEAESIHIIREAVAESENPAMLYSIGKDSSVMLHLARKAFHPSPPPFPLLHVDTRWKFQEMYLFRDFMARESGMQLLVHINPEAIESDINPFDHGSALHTDITKTEGLKQALNHHRFDVVFGGARRDEEKSRAKERIFSFRTATHRWDPKNQRPELWNLFNTRKAPGESIRVFPLSNWTELDIWQYILHEAIPVVPLYFAKPRPVVVREGMLLMVDDDRMRLLPGEEIQLRNVRFRTLGCYPLTGAVESTARSLPEIILELVGAKTSERQGRAIDSDSSGSMERKKQEGYF